MQPFVLFKEGALYLGVIFLHVEDSLAPIVSQELFEQPLEVENLFILWWRLPLFSVFSSSRPEIAVAAEREVSHFGFSIKFSN